MKMELLEKHLLQLETDLLKPEIRQSIEKTSELLADGFVEFCSSGYIWHYNKGESVDEQIKQIDWQTKALFIHDDDNYIRYINDFYGDPAPRLFLGRTDEGNVIRFRYDLPKSIIKICC